MGNIGLWHVGDEGPARLQPGQVAVERDLEDWIERDTSLLEHGLVIVGRQLRLEAGPLDLLALDPQGRWVLIEIKRERLRRDVITQAVDYASCLCDLAPTQLAELCDAYLRSKGGTVTIAGLLEERSRSLADETDGRDVVMYIVGTGVDPGLERMVSFLTRADLSIRLVTLSVFRDAQDNLLLAREFHETIDGPTTAGRRASVLLPDAVLALADQNGVGGAARTLYNAATAAGFYPRPYAKSIMFTPPTNRTRCLLVVWVDRRNRAPGVVKAYISAEAFEQFYGIAQDDIAGAMGGVGYQMLDQQGAERVASGLSSLIAAREAS